MEFHVTSRGRFASPTDAHRNDGEVAAIARRGPVASGCRGALRMRRVRARQAARCGTSAIRAAGERARAVRRLRGAGGPRVGGNGRSQSGVDRGAARVDVLLVSAMYRYSFEDMQLDVDKEVYLAFKATDVHVFSA